MQKKVSKGLFTQLRVTLLLVLSLALKFAKLDVYLSKELDNHAFLKLATVLLIYLKLAISMYVIFNILIFILSLSFATYIMVMMFIFVIGLVVLLAVFDTGESIVQKEKITEKP